MAVIDSNSEDERLREKHLPFEGFLEASTVSWYSGPFGVVGNPERA